LVLSLGILHFALCCSSASAAIVDAIDLVQPKMVKIYGAGGFHDMEAYQSGILISPEGHVLTVFSHVLDTDYITVVLADGRKLEAKLLGADPRLEAAVLKIDAAGTPCFDLDKTVNLDAGARVLAFSNIFGVATGNEPASVQKGTIAVVTRLAARRGVFETPYRGPVYVLDVTTNNSGAAGGALVTRRGELAGMLGKELRNSLNNTWLNYAIPIEQLRRSVDEIRSGKFVARREGEPDKRPERSLDLGSLGIVLIPDVLERTPPYVDHVRPGSPAAAADIRPDDLIVLVGDRLVQSCKALISDLQSIDYEDAAKLTLLRGQELIEVSLRSAGDARPPRKGRP
jgi:S1-C subfamily serine protease